IADVCRAVAVDVAKGSQAKRTITPEDLEIILGPEKFWSETAERTEVPGVATGLAWTAAGGDLLFIEATRMAGKGGITLTGQLGDVMKESAQAALSYTRNKAQKLGIDQRFLEKDDIHKSSLEEDPFEKAAKNPLPPDGGTQPVPQEQPQPGVRA